MEWKDYEECKSQRKVAADTLSSGFEYAMLEFSESYIIVLDTGDGLRVAQCALKPVDARRHFRRAPSSRRCPQKLFSARKSRKGFPKM